MEKKLNFAEKLDFAELDLTAPEVVIQEVLNQLPAETNNIIFGKIEAYSGHVFSYNKPGLSGVAAALGTVDKRVDIQNDLGECGQEVHKFECYLYTPEYDKYKFRVFFVKYNVANYPVNIILEDSVARSISGSNADYIYTCNTRDELESLICNVFNSKRLINVMQELIRINQVKKMEKSKVDTTEE